VRNTNNFCSLCLDSFFGCSFLVADFFTVFLLADFLVLDTGNTIGKLLPHLNEE